MEDSPVVALLVAAICALALVGLMVLAESMGPSPPAWKTLPRYDAITALRDVHPDWSWELRATVVDEQVSERLVEQHPDWSIEILKLVDADRIAIGMTREQAIASWGKPDDINKTVTPDLVHEQWVYWHGDWDANYLYFDNGILTAWQTD
jgi:hypothetical protein